MVSKDKVQRPMNLFLSPLVGKFGRGEAEHTLTCDNLPSLCLNNRFFLYVGLLF